LTTQPPVFEMGDCGPDGRTRRRKGFKSRHPPGAAYGPRTTASRLSAHNAVAMSGVPDRAEQQNRRWDRQQMTGIIEWIGGAVIRALRLTGDFASFTASAIGLIFRPPYRPRLFLEQMVAAGVKSFPVAALTSLFVGMVMVLQTGYQLATFGAKLYSAGITALALAREMIPAFMAVVVGARVASSMTAEVGTMNVTEQLSAMEVLGVDPRHYLVVPRVVATTLMLPVITIYCVFIGIFGGLLVGVFALGIAVNQYIATTKEFLLLSDILSGLVKTFFFGFIIGIVGCYFGFRTRGGAKGVGIATTHSVVLTLVLILISDYLLTTWLIYLVEAL